MQRIILATIVALSTGALVAPAAEAKKNTSACAKAYAERKAVIKKHGSKAAGRNICARGVRFSSGRVAKATYPQKKRYLVALRRLNRPYTLARRPGLPPAGTFRAVASVSLPYPGPNGTRWAIPWYIVACESGGSWKALNRSGAAGPYQIMRMHGRIFPVRSEAARAQHHQIAARLWRGGAGASNWVCA